MTSDERRDEGLVMPALPRQRDGSAAWRELSDAVAVPRSNLRLCAQLSLRPADNS